MFSVDILPSQVVRVSWSYETPSSMKTSSPASPPALRRSRVSTSPTDSDHSSSTSPNISVRRIDYSPDELSYLGDSFGTSLTSSSPAHSSSSPGSSSASSSGLGSSASSPGTYTTPRSRLPVPVTSTLKRSKSGGALHRNNTVTLSRNTTSSRNTTTLTRSSSFHADKLRACLVSAPRSLLDNPTSATARKIIRSKSTEALARCAVTPLRVAATPPLKRSKSTAALKKNTVQMMMKPEPKSTSKSTAAGKSFLGWLKKKGKK